MVSRNTWIGTRIKECRRKAGVSQEELANVLQERYGLKTDRATISKWETGYQEPTITSLKYIAEFFGVTMDYLYGTDDLSQKRDNDPATISRQSLKDNEMILLDLWGEIGDAEKEFFLKQLERAARERGESDNDG